MLDAAISLAALGARPASAARLRELCASSSSDGCIYTTRVTSPGSANVNIFGEMPEGNEACRKVMTFLRRSKPHLWQEESIVLCNLPCFLVPSCGAIITLDGRPIAESLYPTAGGAKSYERILGVGSASGELSELISRAHDIDTGKPCVAFFSRWSTVYFHMMSECLVQDSIFERAAIRPYLHYVSPQTRNGIQSKLVDLRRPVLAVTDADIVRVPRAAFCTVTCRHAAISLSFRNAIEDLRLAMHAQEDSLRHIACPSRLFVSRGTDSLRPLTNEPEICRIFEQHGYAVTQPGKLTLLEQVRQFSNAAVIVGPHGAGLMNAAFARPNALAYELRSLNRKGEPGFGNESYRKVAAIMGHRYGVLVVENEPDSDRWTLPPDKLLPIHQAIEAAAQ